MKTLYDLIGARPDDDADRLKIAFRRAAKASHPDLHAGDPDAPLRFKRIVAAYEILRHAEQKATYDQRLKFEREHSKSQRIISYLMHSIVSDAVAVAGLAIVLAGGYTLFAYISKVPVESVKVAEDTASGPARVAAVQPATQTDAGDRGEPRDNIEHFEVADMPLVTNATLEASSGRALGDAGQVLSPAWLSVEVAKINRAFDTPIDQANAKTAAGRLDKNYGSDPLDQSKARSGSVRISLREKDDGVSKSSLPEFTIPDEKHEMKVPDTPDINTHDTKTPEIKTPGKQRMMAKRQATNHAPFKQVSLENKEISDCSGSQSCSGNVPPLFGVGF
jgi:curved DNA-binding protein CbpA